MPIPLDPQVSARVLKVIEEARPLYANDDPSHDFNHVERVISNCLKLARCSELSAEPNLEFLVAAATLHDIVNLPKNHPERASASRMAAEKSVALLSSAGFAPNEISRVQAIVKEHSYSAGHPATSVESAILQDADRLDALGAIGIMRTVTCGTKFNSSYYQSENGFAIDGIEPKALDDTKFVVDHFYKKLLKLPEKMNTRTGKIIAQKRAEFMTGFLEQLRSESSI